MFLYVSCECDTKMYPWYVSYTCASLSYQNSPRHYQKNTTFFFTPENHYFRNLIKWKDRFLHLSRQTRYFEIVQVFQKGSNGLIRAIFSHLSMQIKKPKTILYATFLPSWEKKRKNSLFSRKSTLMFLFIDKKKNEISGVQYTKWTIREKTGFFAEWMA